MKAHAGTLEARRGKVILLSVGAALALSVPGTASAATTIGSNLAATPAGGFTCTTGCTVAQAALPASSQAPGGLLAPSDGVVVRWRIRVGYTATPVALRITRPGSSDVRTGAGTGPEVRPDSGSDYPTSTFDVRLPIRAGDALGVNSRTDAGLSAAADTVGARYLAWGFSSNPLPLADGGAPRAGTSFDRELLINADIEPDADRDGYGDETQDQCPADPAKHSECDPPQTKITKDAPNKTDKPQVRFKFRSDETHSTFDCKKDGKTWKACSSPANMKHLDTGKHKFQVRAIDPAGNVDPTPAKDSFKVGRRT